MWEVELPIIDRNEEEVNDSTSQSFLTMSSFYDLFDLDSINNDNGGDYDDTNSTG